MRPVSDPTLHTNFRGRLRNAARMLRNPPTFTDTVATNASVDLIFKRFGVSIPASWTMPVRAGPMASTRAPT